MGKFTGVLLASDYDNTLLNTEKAFLSGSPAPVIPPRNLAALDYFMSNGGTFTISTGRAVPSIRNFAADIPCNAPFVVANGAALYDFRTHTYTDTLPLPDDVPDRAGEILSMFASAALELYDTLDTVYAVRPNQYTHLHEQITRVPVVPKEAVSDVPLPVLKMMFEDDHDVLERVQEAVLARNWTAECEVFFTARTLLEVTAKGATKGNMVLRLAARLGIAPENVYCAGDEANDISMLQSAAEGFAPSNCVPAVRDCGATIVGDCADGAIADIIEILDRRY
ncbi:MAG: HAD-IIB family hydrolase [Oscillospiraceae bacterium]|nr:HAD-IIB family hydrolase [Oscillospiraceae bacterium]